MYNKSKRPHLLHQDVTRYTPAYDLFAIITFYSPTKYIHIIIVRAFILFCIMVYYIILVLMVAKLQQRTLEISLHRRSRWDGQESWEDFSLRQDRNRHYLRRQHAQLLYIG